MATAYLATDLVSDQPGVAPITDSHLVNAWGIALNPAGAFWVSSNGKDLSTVYTGDTDAMHPLAKASLEIERGYLRLVPPEAEPERLFRAIAEEHERAVAAVLGIVEARRLLDRHPIVQRSIDLRNPYVDPMNAIQVELLARYRDPGATDDERDRVRPPLLRSITGIAAALRNTG